ncbi:hypothetical protein [Serratia sp. Se-RSBMAAmG]|uniref:hypothetical protein n=1 Tax=Serratia sp. Se-RSBMAAmG TaxID=3043305 RepID=UPI0024AFBFB4|nr:hypothetical protein [Serratia sp. Se-RSBMAAmG]MDI6977138.1 hypothetical protein [Serratia sp. Se-RSBMAAmG]
MKLIVIPSEKALFEHEYTMDACELGLYTESDVEAIKGVVFEDTRKCIGYLPIFYYDGDGNISGFEGWGGDDEVDFGILPESVSIDDKAIVELLPSMI